MTLFLFVMNEAILMYAWKYRCFTTPILKSTSGLEITVLKPGVENTDAGPDFFLAEIKVGDTKWVGNVEIHVKSSDWLLHKHQHDKAYQNVILHVVYMHDCEIEVAGVDLPTLELKPILSPDFLKRFTQLSLGKEETIPCRNMLADVPPIHKSSLLNRMLIERLEDKTHQIHFLQQQNNDLIDSFYQWLLIGFGQKVNKEAFHQLSRQLPYGLVSKYFDRPDLLEALYFGVSGLIPESSDQLYVLQLKKDFEFLRSKHQLETLNKTEWKFLRMRPANFPTIRLAQLCMLLSRCGSLSSLANNGFSVEELSDMLAIDQHSFWSIHFTFREPLGSRVKHGGKDFVRHLLLNVTIPFRFYRSVNFGEPEMLDVVELYADLEAENNVITRKMVLAGFKNDTAADSQALLQLHNIYCDAKKCLLCSIGYQILRA